MKSLTESVVFCVDGHSKKHMRVYRRALNILTGNTYIIILMTMVKKKNILIKNAISSFQYKLT